MKEHDSYKYTVLFGGGAIRGSAHAGVVRALEQLNIEPATLGGSSVGSLVSALYAVGYNSSELADIFLSVNFELFRDISLGLNQNFAISKGEVFLDWIRELIERKYYNTSYVKGQCEPVKFKDISKNLVIITTNMKDFSCQEFSNFETPDFEVALAVRISCCMPGLMKAVNLDNKLLVDGDLMKGKPMWSLSKNIQNSSNRILEIRLEGNFSGTDQSPIEYINGMYTCITSSETSFIKSVYGNSDNYDYLVIDTGDVVVVDFNYPIEKRQAIIDEGYRQTLNYFDNFLVLKKEKILNIYETIFEKLLQVQTFFVMKKFVKAKISIAELFIYIYQSSKYIDNELLYNIQKFQENLYDNVKVGLLGRGVCSNCIELKKELNLIIEDLSKRVKELDKYINKISV